MQKAYASYQFTQSMGRFSDEPAVGLQVGKLASAAVVQARFEFQPLWVVAMLLSHALCQPASVFPAEFELVSPLPPLRCACFPLPAEGIHPVTTAPTNCLNRPTVTSYRSSRKGLMVAAYFLSVQQS